MNACKYCGQVHGTELVSARCHDLLAARGYDAHETHMHRHHELEVRVDYLEKQLAAVENRLTTLEDRPNSHYNP